MSSYIVLIFGILISWTYKSDANILDFLKHFKEPVFAKGVVFPQDEYDAGRNL